MAPTIAPVTIPNDDEPVLVVPRRLTQSAYATLLAHDCVGRKWHLEGRYGSRTFVVDDVHMGLPLLSNAVAAVVARNMTTDRQFESEQLQDLLATDQVEIRYLPVPIPRFVDKLETIVDATAHADRKPVPLPMKLPMRTLPNRIRSDPPAFTFVDLFCGIGGFAVALEALGGQCAFASDIDESCREMYVENTSVSPGDVYGDIYQVPDSELPSRNNVDLLVGGFPCQPFSSLGEQPGFTDGSRGLLYTQIVRVLKTTQPKAFLLENVPGLLEMGEALETIVTALQGAGYTVTIEVCTARCLTAQARKRLFFVGLRNNNNNNDDNSDTAPVDFSFPFMPDLGLRAGDILDYSVGDLDENGNLPDKYEFYRITHSQMDQLLNRSKRWKPARLAWQDKVCDTIDGHYGVTIGKGNSQLVPSPAPLCPRSFTPRECARLMGFPASFRIPSEPKEGQGKRAHLKKQYLMFGNAVCPPLIAVLAGAVLAEVLGIRDFANPNYWRARGLEVGIRMALDSLLPQRQDAVCQRLQKMGIIE